MAGDGLDGFAEWVGEVATGLGFAGADEEGGACGGFEKARDFLLSGRALGEGHGVFGDGLPGFYAGADDRRAAGGDLLGVLWRAAWAETDGVDCALRVVASAEPEEDRGDVVGLDVTAREGFPRGTVVFREEPYFSELACASEEDLRELYRWANGF